MEAPTSDSKVDDTQRMLNEILQQCQTIHQILDTNRFDRMNQTLDIKDERIDRMQQSMQRMKNKLAALEANKHARSMNKEIASKQPHAQLHPLISMNTGEKIANFPATAGAIAMMPTTHINGIFEEIGFKVPVTATPKRKRELLRQVIGLPLRSSPHVSANTTTTLVLRPRI